MLKESRMVDQQAGRQSNGEQPNRKRGKKRMIKTENRLRELRNIINVNKKIRKGNRIFFF